MDPVVIIGGGVVGASIAFHLRDHPRPVVLYERDALGSGASSDSVALFVWHQSAPDELSHELRTRSWAEYGPLVEDGTLSFERTGTLDVASDETEAAELRAASAALDELGVEVSFLEPEAVADHGLDPDAVAGAMWTPEDGYLDPSEIIQHYVREAVEDGRVAGVETEAGTRSAAAVVNAAGPWAPTVNEMAGVSLPFRHNRGPVVVLQKDEPFRLPFVQFSDGLYFRAEGRNQAFAGNFGASYADATRLSPSDARSVDHEFYLDVEDRIRERVPRLEGVELVNEWVGVRTLTPDGAPAVGPTTVDGFFVAAGMNGLGVTLAPAVGAHLADVIAGDATDADVDAYLSPARFS